MAPQSSVIAIRLAVLSNNSYAIHESYGELCVTTFWTFSASFRGWYHWSVVLQEGGSEESVGIIVVMTKPNRVQHAYDHQLKLLVQSTGNVQTAMDLGVPESTARGWLQSPVGEVVSFPPRFLRQRCRVKTNRCDLAELSLTTFWTFSASTRGRDGTTR